MKKDEKKIQEFLKGFKSEVNIDLERRLNPSIRNISKLADSLSGSISLEDKDLSRELEGIAQRFQNADEDILTRTFVFGETFNIMLDKIRLTNNPESKKRAQELTYNYIDLAKSTGDPKIINVALRLSDKSLDM